jgi:poly(A) polymerase
MSSESGRILRDNVYGTLEQDAWRRDFTVNALYYDARDRSVVDYVGAMPDIEARTLRLIGDPEQRFREDPVRILRAIRFAAKLGFQIERATSDAIPTFADLLSDIPPARLYDEVLKLFQGGAAVATYDLLQRYNVFGLLFPDTEVCVRDEEDAPSVRLIREALASTDERVAAGKPITPSFLFAALLWPPLARDAEAAQAQGLSDVQAIEIAGADTIARQVGHVAMPRRFSTATREIWAAQPRLIKQRGKRALGMLSHPRFRASYDFLALRSRAGEEALEAPVTWWTRLQETDEDGRRKMLESGGGGPSSSAPRRRRRRRRRGGAQQAPAT